jgi:hypothetical protein
VVRGGRRRTVVEQEAIDFENVARVCFGFDMGVNEEYVCVKVWGG